MHPTMRSVIHMMAFAVFLTGCVTVMKGKDELRLSAEVKTKTVIKGDYQTLLKCWDDRSEKQAIDFVNQTSLKIFPDLQLGEISIGGANGKYAALIEVRQSTPNEVEISSFGTGYIGEHRLSQWVQVLKKCSADEVG